MAVRFDCPQCGQELRANEKFAGRRALCTACRASVEIPSRETKARTAGPSTLDEAEKVLSALEWEIRFARAAVAVGGEEAAVVAALAARHTAEGGRMAPLPDILQARDVLDASQVRKAMALAKRAELGDSADTREDHLIECPNCFGLIDGAAPSCRFCGEELGGGGELMERCPNCKKDHPPGTKVCDSCGAIMATGVIGAPVMNQCPRCGIMCRGSSAMCPACGTALAGGASRARRTKEPSGAMRVLSAVRARLGIIVLIGIVIFGVWAVRNRGKLSSGAARLIHGEDQASLGQRFDQFVKAAQYDNFDAMAALVDPSLGATAADMQIRRSFIVGLREVGEEVVSIERAERPKISGDQATVYVDVVIKKKKKKQPNAGEEMAGVLSAVSGGGSAGERIENITWRWVKHKGDWYYNGPLA
jgi:hypothetical protein